jgi:hypothetical protein
MKLTESATRIELYIPDPNEMHHYWWAYMNWPDYSCIRDDWSMYCMGGEL